MGRFLPIPQWAVVLPAAVVGLFLGAALQGQTLSPSGPPPTGEVPPMDPPSSAPAQTPASIATVKRYKVKLLSSSGPAFESWIVFDVIGDTTILLLRHATTTGYGKWWDHPVLESKACRIIQADGGDRLVDCQRAARTGPGEPFRIVLPNGAFLQDILLTFTWKESGRIQEGLLRIENGLIPDTLRSGQTQNPEVIR